VVLSQEYQIYTDSSLNMPNNTGYCRTDIFFVAVFNGSKYLKKYARWRYDCNKPHCKSENTAVQNSSLNDVIFTNNKKAELS